MQWDDARRRMLHAPRLCVKHGTRYGVRDSSFTRLRAQQARADAVNRAFRMKMRESALHAMGRRRWDVLCRGRIGGRIRPR